MSRARPAEQTRRRGRQPSGEGEDRRQKREVEDGSSPNVAEDRFRGAHGARRRRGHRAVQLEEPAEAIASVQVRMDLALGEVGSQQRDESAVDSGDSCEIDRGFLDAGGGVSNRVDERRRVGRAQTPREADAAFDAVDLPLCRIGVRVHGGMHWPRRVPTGRSPSRCREGVSSAPRKESRE